MNGLDLHTFATDDLHVEYHGQPAIGTMPIVMVHGGLDRRHHVADGRSRSRT
jgi:hypothetical protein